MNRRTVFLLIALTLAWACLFTLGLVAWLTALRGPRTSPNTFIALTVIPLQTPTPSPYPTPTPYPTSTPTPTLPVPVADFRPGTLVQIVGTQGARLRFRTQPGLQSEVRFLAPEGEIFRVEAGPVYRDGLVWWYLVAPYNTQRAGWAAQPFLQALPPTAIPTP